MAGKYKIVRVYFGSERKRRTINYGLTLEQAQAHCSNPKTSKKKADGTYLWMDCYYPEE